MSYPQKRSPGGQAEASRTFASGHRFHVDSATAEPLLQRLDGVQKSGNGWRAKCPACGGSSRKVAIAERDGRVLVHCFGGCKAIEVLEAVGLSWPDIMPPRHWPDNPEQHRQARRAMREVGWSAALETVALEATIALFAARELYFTGGLEVEDGQRLALAVERLTGAQGVLCGR